MTTKTQEKHKKEVIGIEQFMDFSAILYADSMKNVDERWKETWHICRCARCNKKMSIAGANWDENYSPIHKICPDQKEN